MCDLMRKIQYYENILEFKESTKSPLQQHEVHNWQLCRTCLSDKEVTYMTEFGGNGMVVMGMDGRFMQVNDMLSSTTGIKISSNDALPRMICKDCLSKLSNFYLFKLQTKRAEDVLKRMQAKLNENIVMTIIHTTSSMPTTQITHKAEPVMVTEADCSSNTSEQRDSKNMVEHIMTELENEITKDAVADEDQLMIGKQKIVEQDQQIDEEDETMTEFEKIDNSYVDDNVEVINAADENIETVEVVDIDENADDGDVETSNAEFSEEFVYEVDDELIEELTSQHTEESNNDIQVFEFETESEELCEDESGGQQSNMQENESDRKRKLRQNRKENADSAPLRKRVKGGKTLLDDLTCTICNVTFALQRQLIKHVYTAHPNAKAYKCRICHTMFGHLQSLSRHMQTHQAKNYKKICDVCQKSFLRSDDWARHMRTHTGERPYVCEICAKGFKQACELKEHSRTHSNNRLFECKICGHCLQSRNGLYIHKKMHDGTKNHKCTECTKSFYTKGELKSHSNVHNKHKKLKATEADL